MLALDHQIQHATLKTYINVASPKATFDDKRKSILPQ